MFTRQPPEEVPVLAGYTYRVVQVAVLLLITGTILGGLWADVSWGRFWGWDPKEVWALISGLVYLAILHRRYAGWFGNFGLAVGSIVVATAIAMSWYGVNFWLGVGLHAYRLRHWRNALRHCVRRRQLAARRAARGPGIRRVAASPGAYPGARGRRSRSHVTRISLSPGYAFTSTGSASILAARIKSFSDSPPMACVQSSIETLR